MLENCSDYAEIIKTQYQPRGGGGWNMFYQATDLQNRFQNLHNLSFPAIFRFISIFEIYQTWGWI